MGRRRLDALFRSHMEQLRDLAKRQLRRERALGDVRPTSLINDAFARIAGDPAVDLDSRDFIPAVVNTFKRVCIERARKQLAAKRGARDPEAPRALARALQARRAAGLNHVTRLELEDAIEKLQRLDPRQASLAQLLCLEGLTKGQAAQSLGVSQSTVDRDWRFIKLWLVNELRP